ncbi:MAG: PadR family transcriptional regulator [Oscillospiraceae bacterium]|nr:PadR family transcriptional regulator [Oscillospiraceae bacterium]MBQ2796023.1 PadR family transcriptional regulator [Oscillospiraceae bacterium]MBQ2861818.1 PadR family transcriptional regulator [Oscillospiraceae bacterium]MBQ2997674.1 PadR family transcriptional regulator [Oscillospiraceae bacterium]MBQ3236134.1 PadR family transcriptional regulator [Oscillospiraceae bacterium]
MANKTQMFKGILEGCVLKILSKEKLYSQEICEKFEELGPGGMSRGTVLPLLMRMENEGWIASEKRPIPNGPNRKYYITTEKGNEELISFEKEWSALCSFVNHIMLGDVDNEK